MDDRDIASGSGSSSDMKKKQKLEDSVADEDDSSPMEVEKRRYRSMAKVAIGYGINPLVENSMITEMVHTVCPEFILDTSKLKSAVLEVHEEGKEKVKKMLKDSQGKLTLCYEWFVLRDWTSEEIHGPILNENFAGISVYFADENWKMNKWVLEYHPRGSYGEIDNYVESIKNVILDYEIESKVSTVLMPNCDDLGVEEFDEFRKWIKEKGENLIDSRVFLIYCCSDIFRLMVDDMLKEIPVWLMDCVGVLVGLRRHVGLRPTHWNVSLHNLQEGVDMEANDVYEDEKYDKYEYPSDEEWIKLRTFCKLSGCIYKVATELFDGEYPTSNVYFHLLAELQNMLNEELRNGDNDYFLGKAKKILERFDKYWNNMFLVLATASVLDPRFKMKYLDFYCSKNEVNDDGSKAETVLDYLRSLCARYASTDIRPRPERPDASLKPKSLSLYQFIFGEEAGEEEEDEEEEEKDKKPDGYKDFVLFQEFLKFEGSSREFQESEIDSYLKEPVMEWKKNFNALEWWREESLKYPILSAVACDILSIPISRGTSQRAYVADKRECREFIVSMENKLVNAMMCSESWPRF